MFFFYSHSERFFSTIYGRKNSRTAIKIRTRVITKVFANPLCLVTDMTNRKSGSADKVYPNTSLAKLEIYIPCNFFFIVTTKSVRFPENVRRPLPERLYDRGIRELFESLTAQWFFLFFVREVKKIKTVSFLQNYSIRCLI